MPNFTIHELHTAMSGAVTTQDYRGKADRSTWSVWDWVCALNDSIGGVYTDNEGVKRMKQILHTIVTAHGHVPPFTEEELMERYGRQFNQLVDDLNEIPALNEELFTAEQRALMDRAYVSIEDTDDIEDIEAAEKAGILRRMRADAEAYERQLLGQLREVQGQANPDRAHLRDLTSQLYVAYYINTHAEEWITRSGSEVFRGEDCKAISDRMMREPAYFQAIEAEFINPVPPAADNAAGINYQEQIFVNQMTNRIQAENGAPDNMLMHNPGNATLPRDRMPARLALLRDIKKELDSTGNGYTWYSKTRNGNSTQYEALRAEVQRHIDLLESGLTIGTADDNRMIRALNEYSNGREKPGYKFAQKRQTNVLRLYSEYIRHPAPGIHAAGYPTLQSVMLRYNRQRGLVPGNRDYVDLNNPPYSNDALDFPGCGQKMMQALVKDMQKDLKQRDLEGGRPLDARQQLDLRRNFLRLAAMHNLMVRNRAGGYTTLDEDMIRAEIGRINNDANAPVHGMITAAIRNPEIMRSALDYFDFDDSDSLSRAYFRDPVHFEDPMNEKLRTLSFPTVQERLEQAERELNNNLFPQQGALSPEQQAQFGRLAADIYALRHLMEDENRGPNAQLNDDDFAQVVNAYRQDADLDILINRAGESAYYANAYRAVLMDNNYTLATVEDRTDRLVNGLLDDMRREAAEELRALPDGEAIPDEDAKEAMRDNLVRIAALNNLAHDRDARFPEQEFRSSDLYKSSEIEAAENDVRENQTAFMHAIEPYLTDSTGVKQAFEDMTTTRYDRMLAENEASMNTLADAIRTGNSEQTAQLSDEYRTRFATMIALRNFQRQHGGVNMPVREEALQEEIARVRLSDEYLAVDRMIRTSPSNIRALHDDFVQRGSIDGRLNEMTRTVVAPEAQAGTLGAEYNSVRMNTAMLGDPSTEVGRSIIAMNLFRCMAYREMVLAAPDGLYAPADNNAFSQRYNELATGPRYARLFDRITKDRQTAINAVNTFMQAKDLYTMKVEQMRAQAQNQPYEDHLPAAIDALTQLRYQEIREEGTQQLAQAVNGAKPGVPLTGEQKAQLLNAAAMLIVSRRAPNGDDMQTMPEEERVRQIHDLVSGNSPLAVNLRTAVDRAAMNGVRADQILDAIPQDPTQIPAAVQAFVAPAPAVWADQAWQKLQDATAQPHEGAWTQAEQNDLKQTYALMAAMRERANDPTLASQPVTLQETQDIVNDYLAKEGRDAMLTEAFRDPYEAVRTRCASGSILAAGNEALAQGQFAATRETAKLQRVIAQRNLQKRSGNDHIIASDEELRTEMNQLTRDPYFLTLIDRRNPRMPAVTAAELVNAENFDVLLENTYYNSPARKPLLLGQTPENSFEGRRLLIGDDLRHEQVLNTDKQAERLHIAELYALSLYNDGTWKENELPDAGVITEQARLIANLPDFQTAMDAADRAPEQKAELINALKNGAPAQQITQTLNELSLQQRHLNNIKDVRKSDLKYDVRAAMVQRDLQPLRQTDTLTRWSTEQERIEAQAQGIKKVVLTRDEARDKYVSFLAQNRLYMRNPDRTFFSDAELAAARQEIEADPNIQEDLKIALDSPKEMRFNIFNLAPSQYWTEITAMESGRDVVLNGPAGEATKNIGLQTILYSLVPIVEARMNGRDISGRIINNEDLNLQRNRIAFTEEFIALENALRTDINELDRITDVLKLPPAQFPDAFKKLTDEYKAKYPEAEIPDKNTLGGDYLKAKQQVLEVENADFANDEAARNQLAHGIREIMTIRNIILNSKYDLQTRRNTATESDGRHVRNIEDAENAGQYHMTMRLGEPGWLEEQLKNPETAAKYINIMKGAGDLRRLYGQKLVSGRGLVDPLETQMIQQGLDAPVPSHAERQAEMIHGIPLNVPGETPAQKTARLKTQLAGVANLIMHAETTAPRDMPQDSELSAQSQVMLKVPEFSLAVERLAKDDQLLGNFMQKALQGMNAAQLAEEMNRLYVEEALANNPAANPVPNFLFNLTFQSMNAANEGLNKVGAVAQETWSSQAAEREALQSFLHYTAVNRLMAQNPGRLYFTEDEYTDSFVQSATDEQLRKEFEVTSAGGPKNVRQHLFSYGGGAYLTDVKTILDSYSSLDALDDASREIYHYANLRQLGAILWLQDNNLVEQNHFTTTKQTDEASDEFLKSDESKLLLTAAELDPYEQKDYLSRILPHHGANMRQEMQRVVEEYRRPLDMERRSERNIRTLENFAFVYPNSDRKSALRRYMGNFLADAVNIALHKGLPADEQPNAEQFLSQRKAIMAIPEFQSASIWLGHHPEELKKFADDLRLGMTPEQVLARINEASVKQQTADKNPNPSSNIQFRIQLNEMKAQRRKYWSKCGAETVWQEGVKEQFIEDFLDFTAMDALLKANPNRVYFSREEIRAARVPFEQNRQFMADLEEALASPKDARNGICAFAHDNTWNYTEQALMQQDMIVNTLKKNPRAKPDAKLLLANGMTGCLAQAAVCKLTPGKVYKPFRTLEYATDDMSASLAFRAIAHALADDPGELNRVLNEVFSLQGDAFRSKLDQVTMEYMEKYSDVDLTAESEKMKTSYRILQDDKEKRIREEEAKAKEKEQQPEVKQPEVKQPEVKQPEAKQPEVKQAAPKNVINEPKPEVKPQPKPQPQPQNNINIINEPKQPEDLFNILKERPNHIYDPLRNDPKIMAAQKPTSLVVPEKENRGNALGQYQHTAGMLERTIYLQQASDIPIKDELFVDAAENGILKTVAYRNLADQPAFRGNKVDKDTLNAEMERLRKDPALAGLRKQIESGHAKTLLEGIKKLDADSEEVNRFLKAACTDPVKAIKIVNAEYPEPAERYLPVPTLPKTTVSNDLLPDMNQKYPPNSPMGRYQEQMQLLEQMRKASLTGSLGKGINYRDELMNHMSSVYALRQIIAHSPDPTKPDDELLPKNYVLMNKLSADDAFNSLVDGCVANKNFADKVENQLKLNSFKEMNKQLQTGSESYFRHTVKQGNAKIDAINQKNLNAAQEQKDKDINGPGING